MMDDMDATAVDSATDDVSSVLPQRLAKLSLTIQKATEEACKQASLSSSPRSVSTLSLREEQPENASFLLGMDLFGQDPHTLERGIRDKLEDVESELKRVLQLSNHDKNNMDDAEEFPRAITTDLDPQELAGQVQAFQAHVAFLKEASLARSALDESSTVASPALTAEPSAFQASQQLVVAQKHYNQAQELASPLSQQERHSVQILQGLQHAIRRQRVELIHKASSVLDTSLTISTHELSVKSSMQLEEAFQVLETLEGGPLALEETMRRWTGRLYDKALSPLLEPFRHKTTTTTSSSSSSSNSSEIPRLVAWKVVDSEDQPTKRIIGVSASTTKGVVHRIQWRRMDEERSTTTTTSTIQTLEWPTEAWKDTLQALQRILLFVQTKMLLQRERLCELVGNKLFGKPAALPSQLHLTALGLESTLLGDDKGLLMEALVHLMAQTCLPDQLDATQVTAMLPARSQELLEACAPFCKALVDCHLLVREPTPKLISFCEKYAQNYVEHRRCVLLNQARDILRNHDYHNTITVGVDEDEVKDPSMSIFLLHKSCISEIASQLMSLVRQTMDESVIMPVEPATLRPTLYKTAREMLSLFRAIISASHGHEVATVPRTAAVLHNDCIYFAHHCLTLGLEFKERYSEEDARGKLLHQTCIFVDMVPLFRELADQSLGDMLDVQADQLVEIVGSRITYLGPSLQSNESLHEWSEAETALAAGIYHLRHLAQSWRPILSKRIFAQSLGHLADVILTLYWNQVTPKAPAKTAHAISPNARHFLLGLFRKALNDLQELLVDPKPERCLEDCSSEWGRFQSLLQFLDMSSLAQVQAALTSGVFRQVAGPELALWIRASYQVESPERRALLQTLSGV